MNKDVDLFYKGLIKASIENLKELTDGYEAHTQKRLSEAEKRIHDLENEIKALKSSSTNKDSSNRTPCRPYDKSVSFGEVPIGAVFTLVTNSNISYVKLADPCIGVSCRDIPKQKPNALKLDNGHYVTLMVNARCVVVKRLEDFPKMI